MIERANDMDNEIAAAMAVLGVKPDAPDYGEYRQKRRSQAKFDPAVREDRRKEQQRRAATAQSRALTALSRLHTEDYRRFYQAAQVEIRQERGPLPGDDSQV